MPKKVLKELARETMEAVMEVTEQVSAAVKETVEKDPAVAEAVKEAADKTKKVTKKTVKKATAAAKKVTAPLVKETYIQYYGKEISQSEIEEKVIADYLAEGHKKSDIIEIELYIKPEDNAVYYVINGTDTGKVYI